MEFDVIVSGGGPTGLMLASELRLAGVRVAVLERLAQPTGLSKALGFHVRSVETLAYRGILERFTAGNQTAFLGRFIHFAGLPLDCSDIESSTPYALGILQARTEAILEARATELGAEIRRGHRVQDVRQDGNGVTVEVAGPENGYQLRAAYVVGCDGAHSVVRQRAGIGFLGSPATLLARMGDVSLSNDVVTAAGVQIPGLGQVAFGIHRTEAGMFTVSPLGRDGVYRVSSTEWGATADDEAPTLDELRASVRRVLGTDLPMQDPRWVTRFTDATRQAERYRAGRLLIAGDAAHIHFPSGGQGLNMGLQDAVNLGWKLAAQLRGWGPPELLDTYDGERRPLGARVLSFTRSQVALLRPGAHTTALRELFVSILRHPEARREIVQRTAQVDTRYDMDEGAGQHPLVGRWAPDLVLRSAGGRTRVSALGSSARGVILLLGEGSNLKRAAAGWADRVDVVSAETEGPPPAPALVIRPDGYVAWAAGGDEAPATQEQGLRRALARWFGSAPS